MALIIYANDLEPKKLQLENNENDLNKLQYAVAGYFEAAPILLPFTIDGKEYNRIVVNDGSNFNDDFPLSINEEASRIYALGRSGDFPINKIAGNAVLVWEDENGKWH